MKSILTLFLVGTISASGFAQTGKTFPAMSGVLLNNKKIDLPFKNKKFSVIAIAYNRSAEDQLKDWLNPLYNLFIVKNEEGSNFDMAEIYNVDFVFIPMISGFKKVADNFKSNTDKEFWPYIMDTEKTDIQAIQKELGVVNTTIPYFYVVDVNGKIVAAQSGAFNETKLDIIEDAVE